MTEVADNETNFQTPARGAQTDRVKAELRDGVPNVRIPVPEVKAKARQVPVAG